MIETELVSNPQATGNMRWYVIHAYSGMEKSVKRGLEERIARSGMPEKFGRILVPSEEVVEIKAGQKSVTERRFFPGYVLIEMEMTDESWHLVKNTPKVTGFVGGVITAVVLSLSLHPLSAAAVVIAPKGKNGIPANHLSRSRRLG